MELMLDHFVIAASDLDRTKAFYAEVFNASVLAGIDLFEPEQLVALSSTDLESVRSFGAFRFSNAQINVHGPGVKIDASLLARHAVRPGNSDFCFEWPGPIAQAVAHLVACKVAIEIGPRPASGRKGAGTSVYFRDPDGSLLEFISYPDTA